MASDDLRAFMREIIERLEKRDDEHRMFMREMTERNARITDAMIAALQELGADIADQREQIQANTKAVLRVLDRLGPEPA